MTLAKLFFKPRSHGLLSWKNKQRSTDSVNKVWIIYETLKMDADSDSASKRHPDFYKAKMSSSITHHFDPDSSRFQHKTQAMSVDNSDMDESHGKSVPSVFDSEPDQNWCTRIGHKYDCHGGCLPNRRDHRQRNRPFSLGLLLILTCVLLHTLAPCVSAKLELGKFLPA